MMLHLHHIFVCTAPGAPEAEGLLEAGLVEGSPNTHPGQGTANRRFFFESGYLELLWVHDEQEAKSPLTAPTRLWDRWAERDNAANPFGICLASRSGAIPSLPFATWAYRPDYLPEERCILFAADMPLSEPEVFVLSGPRVRFSPETEPVGHSLGLRAMQSVSIGLPDPASMSNTLRVIRDAGFVRIHGSDVPELVIGFTSKSAVHRSIPALRLSVDGV